MKSSRRTTRWLAGLGATLVLAASAAAADTPAAGGEPEPVWAARAAKVIALADLPEPRIFDPGLVVVQGDRIVAVGRPGDVELPEGCEVRDFGARWIVPGLVEAHSHAGGGDINDMVHLSNPDLSITAGVVPENRGLENALAGGVTTLLFIPGSGTNIGGHGILLKSAGTSVEQMVVRDPGCFKLAQAGNPERYWYGVARSYMNWNTRDTIERGKAYHEAWEAFEAGTGPEPEFDERFETMRGLFRGEFPVALHTQWYQVALESITMLKIELGLDIFIDHGTFEAWRLGSIAERYGVPVVNGPRQIHFDRNERQIQGNCWGWWKEGVRELGINTDAGVVPQHELSYQAAMAVHFGLDDPLCALRGVTIVPARVLGIEERVGSLEAGKDADFGVWTGDPIDPSSACLLTVVDGRVAYDASRDGRRF